MGKGAELKSDDDARVFGCQTGNMVVTGGQEQTRKYDS
jgi:hypothetical protein